jgi:phage protein D
LGLGAVYSNCMTQVINLRQARKDKARSTARAQADANAAKHGRSKAERLREQTKADKARAHLDGHMREP